MAELRGPSKGIFPSFKLPGELRNEVYKVLPLKKEERIVIGFERCDCSTRNNGRCMHLIAYDPQRYVSYPYYRVGLQTSLLSVCRQMRAETAPVLYGQNDFSFADTRSLWYFLKHVESSRWLTAVHWNATDGYYGKVLFSMLADHTNVTSLSWSLYDKENCGMGFNGGPQNATDFFDKARPLLRRMKTHYEDDKKVALAINAVVPFEYRPLITIADDRLAVFRGELEQCLKHLY